MSTLRAFALSLLASLVTPLLFASHAAAQSAAPSGSSPVPAAASANGTLPSLPELSARVMPSVVLLTAFDSNDAKHSTGTGFFVSPAGWLVTNHHVIDGASRMTATMPDGRVVALRGILADDPDDDLAILQAEGDGYPALPFGGSANIRVGDDIAVIGSPHGLSATLSIGIVAAIRPKGMGEQGQLKGDDKWEIQVTAATSPGSSGSPVLSRAGEVVAIVVGGANGEGMTFCLRVELAKNLVASLGPTPKLTAFARPSPRSAMRNLAISAGVFASLGLGTWLVMRSSRKKAERIAQEALVRSLPRPKPRAK